ESAKALDANRKAMDSYGKSVKKASSTLASFDELNVLDTSQDDGGGAGGIGAGTWEMEPPDLDITGIQAKMDTLVAGMKSTFDGAFQWIRSGWQWTVDTFGPSFQTAWSIISPELELWKESFRLL